MTREPGYPIHEQDPSRFGRVAAGCGKVAMLGTLSVGLGVTGLFVSGADTSFGPHEAHVELTLDSSATFDLGPIGSVILPLEDEHGLGAHVTIGAPSATQSAEDQVDRYARSLANIDDTISNMESDLRTKALHNSLLAAGGILGLYGLIGNRRRGELIHALQGKLPKALIAMMIFTDLAAAGTIGISDQSAASEIGIPVDSSFVGTILENARVTGYLPEFINTYGREIINRWRENDRFYDRASENLARAFETQQILHHREGYPIMLFYTDIHCNVGMARIIGDAARYAQADLIADGGDTTMTGQSIEEFCIQILDSELPEVPRAVAGGNHDSDATEEQEERNGFEPLNGAIEEIAGLTILGDDDVMRSELGAPLMQEGDETLEELSARIADTACQAGGVDVLLLHEPAAAVDTIDQNCARTVLTGHTHREEITLLTDRGDQPVLSLGGDNASGASTDRPSLGPVSNESPARFYLLKFDQDTHQVMAYQSVTIYSDTSVEIGTIELLPLRNPTS